MTIDEANKIMEAHRQICPNCGSAKTEIVEAYAYPEQEFGCLECKKISVFPSSLDLILARKTLEKRDKHL